MSSKQDTSEAGFSLSEVLIGFAIVSISLAITYQAISSSLRTSALTQEASLALALAQEKLTLVGYEIPVMEGMQSGTEPLPWYVEMTVHEELAAYMAGRRGSAPYAVTVVVDYGAGPSPRSVELHSIALGHWVTE